MFKSKSIAKLYTKVIVSSLAMFVILLVPFTIIIIKYFETQAEEYSKSSAQIINSTIDNYFNDIYLSMSNYIASREISLALRINDDEMNNLAVQHASQIKSQITTMFMHQPGVEFIVLSLEGSVGVNSSASIVNVNYSPLRDKGLQDFINSDENSTAIFMHDREYYSDGNEPYVTAISKIPDYINWDETIGFFIVDVTLEVFQDFLASSLSSEFEFYVENENSQVVYSQNISDLIVEADNAKLVSHVSDLTGLTINIVPLFPGWQNDVIIISVLLIVATILYFSIVLVWCYYQSRKIAVPIYELEKSMKNLKNNNYSSPPKYSGQIIEISSIYKSMNDLIDSLSMSIEDNYRKDLLLMKSKLRYLNEKIQPHFLYNTLEIISNQAITDGSQSTAKMCQMLGKMFRYSLHSSDKVTLKQEVENINNYIMLKTISAGYDNFTFNADVDDEIINCSFPKMSLQPIIENCFKHGYSHQNKNFTIDFSIKKCGENKIEIRISDNGVGMAIESLTRLKELLSDADTNYNYDYSNGGFGLTHCISQMRMFFEEHFSVSMDSIPNEKTEISIVFIPA